MARLPRTAVFISLFLMGAAPMHAQHTYYISKSTGSDSNAFAQAQSKSTPWAHLPGMAGCASNCASYTPVAGDNFIMMGCDVWTGSDLPVVWQWNGSSGSQIYVGVDKTWYNTTNCPSGWNRPVWNAAKTVMSGDNYFIQMGSSGTGGNGYSYLQFDNIEFKQQEFTSGSGGGIVDNLAPNTTNFQLTNSYIHAWDAAADNCVFFRGPYGAGPPVTAINIVYSNNVIDGSDRTGTSGTTGVCYAFYYNQGGSHVINNVIRFVVNPGVVASSSTGLEIGGNWIDNVLVSVGGSHCNGIETNGGTPFYIHDNVFSNMNCAGGETLSVANSAGEVDYVWNNVIYNLNSAQQPGAEAKSGGTGMFIYFWNNTVVPQSGASCLANGLTSGDTVTVYFQNNDCITTSWNAVDSFSGFGTGVAANTNNILQAPSTAASRGYSSSETYVYSPPASGCTSSNSKCATVGAGINLTSSWPSGFSTNDTQYGMREQTVNGVVQAVTGRPQNSRPASGAWDSGAYQYGSTQASAPNPPTGLTASAQ